MSNALQLEDPDIPVHICLHHCHLGFTVMMGPHRKRVFRTLMRTWGAQAYLLDVTPQSCIMVCAGPWPEVTRPIGNTNPIPLTFTWLWFQEWQKFSVNLLIGVIAFQQSVHSRCMLCGQCHREPRGHMKINLPVFKDEDKKDAITYQIWHWDIMVYCWAWCWDCTLLPYVIHYLQGYQGELVRNLGTDVTLGGVLTILDEHYNNIKALVALNQELFQQWTSEKETLSEWGCPFWGTSKSSWPPSYNAFCQTTSLNWSMTTSMAGCLSSLKWW